MASKSIEKTLKELGSKNDTTKLEEFVKGLDDEKICALISNTICHSDAPQLLSYLYQGLSQNGSVEIKRFKVTEKVLKELQSRKLNNRQVNAIVSRLALEVEKLTPEHLVQFSDYCIHCIQHDDGDQTSWKDLLPQLLSLIVVKDTINHEGIDVTGAEYKLEVIRTLLMVKWRPTIVTSLASMFTEIQLTNDQHLQVVNKLCASFEELGPSEIPPLVHHLLQVCKNHHGVALFLRLQSYFCTRLYNHLLPSNRESEGSNNLDAVAADSIEFASDCETQYAEATVLFHIHQSARFGHASIKNYMKFMRSVTNAPELVLEPFLLTVLLSLSTISIYEEQVYDVFKCTMQRVVQEEDKKRKSAWLFGVTPQNCNVELLLMKLMENSVRERSSVSEGLVNIAFLLLGATALKGREAMAEKLWGFGIFILLKLVKKHHEATGTVLQLLTDRIITGEAVTQYTDCLYQMSLSVPLVLNEYRPIIINLLELLTQLPGHVAQNVVHAVLPIVRAFHSLRDVLIIVLRKALFSRDIGTRKMAVSGFLELLKKLDVKGMAILSSQSSGSNSQSLQPMSILTQIDMEMGNSSSNNEAICLELLGVLRRCFMQQADVRRCLYEGLHSGIIRNPELNVYVQDMLINHFSQFYESDIGVLPPLKFSKAVVVKDITAELQEPLGHLVFAIQQVATTDLRNNSSKKLINILESLCERMIKCSLGDFGLNETTNLVDILPESQQQQEMVRQMLGVYEALMGYTMSAWSRDNSTECAQKLGGLFKGYSKLAEFAKNSNKPGKKADGDDGVANRRKKADGEKKAAAKGRATGFRFPHTVLDYKVAYKMLCLLHRNSVDWCTSEAANHMKGHREFSRFVLEVVLSLIKTSISKKSSESASAFHFYIDIGSLLYSQCVCKLEEFTEFDVGSSVLALEAFNELFSLVSSQHKDRLDLFLADVGDVPVKEGQAKQLLGMATKYEELLTSVVSQEDDAEDDPGAKKIPPLLIQGLTQCALQIQCQDPINKVLNWVKTFARDRVLPDLNLTKKVLSLLFTLELRCKGSSQLYAHVAMQLCELIGMVENGEKLEKYTSYRLVKAGNEIATLLLLCDTVKQMLDHVEWVLARLRAEYIAMTHSVADKLAAKRELLKSKELDVVNHVSYCVQILNYVSSLALEPGPSADAVLKLLTHQYMVLTALTKYFTLRTTKTNAAFQAAKFEMVVKLAGKYLSPHVYNLISHIEANQKKKGKKEVDPLLMKSKVLRETRCIPKLVFELEQFEKCIIELSKKSKVDLMNCVKLNTYRDFRIHVKRVQAADADDQDQSIDESTSVPDNNHNESSTVKEPARKKPRKE